MASKTWEEIRLAKTENRRELTLQGAATNQRIQESGLDNKLFTLSSLNLLKIAGAPLESISSQLGKLTNLTSLLLENNVLKELPDTVGELTSLKTLDISGNKLKVLPETVSNLVNLQSLNANLNLLESFPNISNMKQLAFLSISRNKLTSLPDGICDPSLALLSTVEASCNEIEFVPPGISNLPHLIKLDVGSNKLDSLPLELCECVKLKELIIVENKMKDRKLLKLAEHSTKSLLNYLNIQLDKQRIQEGNKNKKDKGKKKKKKGDQKDVEELARDIISVLQFEDKSVTVSVSLGVMSVRQYIVCCVIKNLDFSKSNNMFKRFINLQTKLHENICQKRQSATIATHDLDLVKGPLLYDAVLPKDLQILPLFKPKSTTGEELMKQLREEAEALRKEKKRSAPSGIHKYLDLLKDKSHYPCLKDADGDVISFPPITNSEKTKISKETKCILLEVTSTVSLEMCKKVMEELLMATLLTGVGTPAAGDASQQEGVTGEGATEDHEDEGDESGPKDMSRVRVPQSLTVEQVKVTDHQGNLRVIYPSRVDLQNPAFDVIRNYE